MTWLQDHQAWLVAGAILGVVLVLIGVVGMAARDMHDWWQSRRRVGRQVPGDQTSDRPYRAGIARGGDR